MAKKSQKNVIWGPMNTSSLWEGFIYSSTVSISSKERNLNEYFSKMGELSFWGLIIPGEDDQICSEYDNCTNPLYEYILKTLDACFPFTIFEVGVLTT